MDGRHCLLRHILKRTGNGTLGETPQRWLRGQFQVPTICVGHVGPSLVRAQALADPVPVARAIVSAKLKANSRLVVMPPKSSTLMTILAGRLASELRQRTRSSAASPSLDKDTSGLLGPEKEETAGAL